MNKLVNNLLPAFGLVAFLQLGAFGQMDLELKWTYGYTNYSYFSEGFYRTSMPNFYPKSLVTAPTFGTTLYAPKLNLGLEQSFYLAVVPSSDSLYDLSYAKQSYTLGAYYLLMDKWKFSLFYSVQNFNNKFLVGYRAGSHPTILRGLGLGFGYKAGNSSFEVRKELINSFNDGTRRSRMRGIEEHWTFRFQKELSFKNNSDRKSSEGKFFDLVIGLTASGNEIGRKAMISNVKVFPTIGIESASIKNFSLYVRRSQWYHMDIRKGVNFKFTSQLNYLGLAYRLDLRNESSFRFGIHHLWNGTRGIQFLDTYVTGITTENLWFVYNNQGVGLDIRYRMANSNFDFVLNSDYYYKTRTEFPSGFNRESLRLGVLYNF